MFFEQFEFPIFFSALIANIVLGLIVFRYAQKKRSTRIFLYFIVAQLLWITVNYLSFHFKADDYSIKLFLSRLTMFFATFHSFTFFLFVYTFLEDEKKINKKLLIPLIIFLSLTSLITLTPWFFTSLQINQFGDLVPVSSPAVGLFGIFTFLIVILAFHSLLKKRKKIKNLEKMQWRYLAVGVTLTFLLILTFSFISFVVFKNITTVRFGHLYTLPFVIFTTFAVTRHHLMDIHIVLRRSVIVFGVFCLSVILTSLSASYIARSMNGILVVSGIITILLLASPYIKNSIDTFVRKIFPVELVDISTFFDRTIYKIRTESIEEFMKKLQKFITDNFHVESHVFLRDHEKKNWYTLICGKKQKVKAEEILEKSIKIAKMIIDGSELENEHSEGNTLFVPMKHEDEVIGCIVLEGTQEKALSNEQADMLCELGPRSAKVIHDLRVLERAKTGARILANRLR